MKDRVVVATRAPDAVRAVLEVDDREEPPATSTTGTGSTRLLRTLRASTRTASIALVAGAAGVLVSSLVLLADGSSPRAALATGWDGALGDMFKFGVTANRAAPFLLAAVGFIVAYRAGLLNVGAEGQIFVGGAAAGAVALAIGADLTSYVGIPIALAAAAVAGGLISLVAGALYLWRGVSIVLSTLLLNFVAIQFVSYLVRTPELLQEQGTISSGEGFEGTSRAFPQSDQIAENFRLARLSDVNQAHLGIVLALAAAVAVALLLSRTSFGFRIRAIGLGRQAAQHAGIPYSRTVLEAMFLAGAFAGLAGASLVLGDRYRVLETVSEGYGFVAILAALLARGSPIGAIATTLLFATLQRGGQVMEASGEAPEATVLIMQAVIVIFVACAFEVDRRWARRRQVART